MTLVPIDIPPGIYRNGTPYGARGRWFDCNLVRWQHNSVRSIGGWFTRIYDGFPITLDLASEEVPRSSISYTTNDGRDFMVIGTNESLVLMDNSNELIDITPVGFTGGASTVANEVGFGISLFGRGPFGTARNAVDAKAIPVPRWRFDTFGENLIGVFNNGEGIWEYAPDAAAAVPVANAPTGLTDVVVTDERIVMGIRNGPDDIREVIWSDREDNTAWTPSVDNYAGGQVLQGVGQLVGLYKVQSQVLILSDTDAYVANYLGAPFVYGFQKIGERCAPVSQQAVVSADRFAMWMGQQGFWTYDGSLKHVSCEVMDYLNSHMDKRNTSKMFSMSISEFNELWWFYQSVDSDEVDSYVIYDYAEGHWSIGSLDRTTGVDKGALNSPVMITPTGTVYNHEQVGIIPDGTSYATTGPLELSNGSKNMAIRHVFVDTQAADSITLSFDTRQLPNAVSVSHGPYAQAEPVSTTGVLGREVQMTVTGIAVQWEVGQMRFDVQEVGGGFR